jgi:outer membrane protein OmpA-like peptidoglycan-associated protein
MTRHRFYYVGLILLLIAGVASAGIAEDKGRPQDGPAASETQEAVLHRPAGALSRPNHRFFNVRLTGGADVALGDTLEKRGLGEVGGQGAIGVDWVIVEPLAFSILVGYSAFASGDEGALQDLFATVGFRLRLFTDKKGALNQPGGNAAGHLFLDAHFGYHGYENQEHAGYNIGLGYEFSLAKDFNLGPYCRFAHTPIGDGFSYLSIAFGLQVSVGGKFKPDDADKDGVEDDADNCPLEAEDKDGFDDDDGCPDSDNDQDGVLDEKDKCPDIAGVASNGGCAETDNDHDGVLNESDDCPDDAEDRDGFEDRDGCPDPDNDGDGILDAGDKCPRKAEDRDGFEDEDGCPDRDNDKDGIPDLKDRCPVIPETKNGVEDADGCPDYSRLEEGRIVLLDKVYFDKQKPVVSERSFPMLEEVAALMTLKPDIAIRVESHTDNRGGAKQSLKTSQRRAESVKAFLISKGVAESRIVAVGRGAENPVADNKTKAGREQNDRIEIYIVNVGMDGPDPSEEAGATPPAAPVPDKKNKK